MSPGKKYLAKSLAGLGVCFIGLALIFVPVIRAIDGSFYEASASEVFHALAGLTVRQMVFMALGIGLIKFSADLLPEHALDEDVK